MKQCMLSIYIKFSFKTVWFIALILILPFVSMYSLVSDLSTTLCFYFYLLHYCCHFLIALILEWPWHLGLGLVTLGLVNIPDLLLQLLLLGFTSRRKVVLTFSSLVALYERKKPWIFVVSSKELLQTSTENDSYMEKQLAHFFVIIEYLSKITKTTMH